MEFSCGPLARLATALIAALIASAGRLLRVPRLTMVKIVFAIAGIPITGLAIPGCKLDLNLVEFVPLRFGALAVRNRKQFLQPAAGGNRLLCVHAAIIPLFGKCRHAGSGGGLREWHSVDF